MEILNDNSCGWIDYKNKRTNIKKLSDIIGKQITAKGLVAIQIMEATINNK